jgi:hypothetical protein
MKRQLPTLRFEEGVIAAVVVDPDPEEESEDEEAVDDGASGEIHVCRRQNRPAQSFSARLGQRWAGMGRGKAESCVMKL